MALFGQQTRKEDGFPRSEDRVEPQVEVAPYLAPVPHVPTRSMEETRPTMTTALKNSESILAAGLTIEYQRNEERYKFLRQIDEE